MALSSSSSHGTKLQGKWTLIRMGREVRRLALEPESPTGSSSRSMTTSNAARSIPITDAEPNSAVTGRTIEEIAHQEDHVWNSKEHCGRRPRLVSQGVT